ncbi:FAD-dependent oxidoreductase [Lysobacter solisilvae (ex Woo and Kim 2020)]|uniref:FAD-dependent monooxygenase n=1 Tax=Agrilutibacter terrestris TaxID=2865112 RepID=A0A7H0FY74_9GAMM|nr:NAD(P)/FAD-dependent oxidoreductase [Lysobacter terrestris]QNP40990.1 FAD-dependent monooxygenase [Lysobacter terrestris]
MKPLRIAIVGYGTGGQAAAVLLSRDGHHVEVFEQADELGPVGAGFLLQPTGMEVLWRLGLLDAALAHGARVHRLFGETHDGRAVMDMRYRELDRGLFGLGMQRGALFGLLDAAWQEGRRIHCGRRIVGIDAERGVVRDQDGIEHGAFDLLVVADGAASKLRGEVGTAALDRPYPWGAQWCLVPRGAWAHVGELRQRYVGARRMAGMLPVGTRPGDDTPRMSFFWSVPAASLQAEYDAARWRADVAAVWPEAADMLRDTAVPEGLAKARYRDASHRRWHRGRAVLLGDAAHAMSPQLGQGANMALIDALVLRDALRTHDELAPAFASYERARREHVAIYHFWSRWLTPLFQSELDTLAALRDRLFNPLTRMPGGRRQVLRVLTGTRRGWLGVWPLDPDFRDVLDAQAPAPAGDARPASA